MAHALGLPDEVTLQIFSYVELQDLGSLACVCNQWYRLSTDDSLWYRHVLVFNQQRRANFLKHEDTIKPEQQGWKEVLSDRVRSKINWSRGKCKATILKDTAPVVCNKLDKLRNRLIFGSLAGGVKIYDLATYSEVKALSHSDAVFGLALAPDGNTLATGSNDQTVKFWDAETYDRIGTTPRHGGSVRLISFLSPQTLIAAGKFSELKLWDTKKGSNIRVLNVGAIVHTIYADSSLIIAGTSSGHLLFWSTETGQLLARKVAHSDWLNALDVNGNLLATGSADCTISCWDLRTRNLVQRLEGHTAYVNAVLMRGFYMASCSNDTTVRIWDSRKSGKHAAYRELRGHTDWVSCIDIRENSLDGSLNVISAGVDSDVRIWSPDTGDCLFTLGGYQKEILSLSVDEHRVFSTSWNSTVCVWDFDVPSSTPPHEAETSEERKKKKKEKKNDEWLPSWKKSKDK